MLSAQDAFLPRKFEELLTLLRHSTPQWALPLILMSPRAAFALDDLSDLDMNDAAPVAASNAMKALDTASRTFTDTRTGKVRTY